MGTSGVETFKMEAIKLPDEIGITKKISTNKSENMLKRSNKSEYGNQPTKDNHNNI